MPWPDMCADFKPGSSTYIAVLGLQFRNFTGLMMDGGTPNPAINLQKEFMEAENIVGLFKKYSVSHNILHV